MSSTSAQPKPLRHEVEWSEQKIGEFWNIMSDVNGDQFFSHRASGVFLDIAGKHLGRKVLDVGCGLGGLVREMRRRGYDAMGVDPSPPDEPYLIKMKGTELDALGKQGFDSAVSLETFEHVLPAELPATFSAIARVLRPGGKLVFTIACEENLQEETCVCPDCHATFHRWQHLQSFSQGSITNLLQSAGLEPLSFRGFELPFAFQFVPNFLRPAFSRFWAWLRKRYHRKSSVLVVAQRRA
ncbi:MAG TPA: class I SAM-dependent methyltransferase [Terriglobia bacterium]|nr:class I SAM-dependent methyltransferase [Terriglobia bacterium]